MLKVRQLKKGQLHVAMILQNAGMYIQDRRAFFMVEKSNNLVGFFDTEDEGTAILRKVKKLLTQAPD